VGVGYGGGDVGAGEVGDGAYFGVVDGVEDGKGGGVGGCYPRSVDEGPGVEECWVFELLLMLVEFGSDKYNITGLIWYLFLQYRGHPSG